MKFTLKALEALKPKAQAILVWDTEVRGLALKVHTNGTKSFYVIARLHGRQRKSALERLGVSKSIETIRNKARAELGRFADANRLESVEDPLTQKRRLREQAKKAKNAATVAELADLFEREQLSKRKPATRAQFSTLRRHFLPALGKMPIERVTYNDVSALHAKLGARYPIQANRVLAALSAMFTLARKKGLRTGENPVRGIERFPEHRREVRLHAGDFARLGRALDEIEAEGSELPSALAAVRLLALSGARLKEILSARWSELDVEAGMLRVVDHKTSRRRGPKYIVLGRAALDVIAGLRDPKNKSEWIIAGRGGHLVGFARPWARVLDRAGLSDRRPHDLRRSFASVASELGYPESIVGELLGHSKKSVTAGYTLPGSSAMRRAANDIAGAIAGMLRGEAEPAGQIIEGNFGAGR